MSRISGMDRFRKPLARLEKLAPGYLGLLMFERTLSSPSARRA